MEFIPELFISLQAKSYFQLVNSHTSQLRSDLLNLLTLRVSLKLLSFSDTLL